ALVEPALHLIVEALLGIELRRQNRRIERFAIGQIAPYGGRRSKREALPHLRDPFEKLVARSVRGRLNFSQSDQATAGVERAHMTGDVTLRLAVLGGPRELLVVAADQL